MKILLAILCSFIIHGSENTATYYPVKIIMINGSELNGLADFPTNPVGPPIPFKVDKKSKKRHIACDSIKTLIYFPEEEHPEQLDKMEVLMEPGDKKTEHRWLELFKKGRTTLYKYHHMDPETGFSRSTGAHVHWICIGPGESFAKTVSCEIWKKKIFIETAVAYFKDDIELTKKIESGEYKWNDMEAIVDEYNIWKNK